MAHSAGAPYALAFANKVPERVRGDVLLLAPWVGSGEFSEYTHLLAIGVQGMLTVLLRGRLQMAQIRTYRDSQDGPGSRMEDSSMDAWQASNHRIRRHRLRPKNDLLRSQVDIHLHVRLVPLTNARVTGHTTKKPSTRRGEAKHGHWTSWSPEWRGRVADTVEAELGWVKRVQ